MSSPAPSASSSPDDDTKTKKEDITFKFCRECSNMLYPKEDRMTSRLMFACRTCQFSEEAKGHCVFRNTIHNTVGENSGVTQDVGSDPTVRDSAFGNRDEVFESCADEFCCTLCGREIEWCCVFCGEELEIMLLQVGGLVEGVGDGEVGVRGLTLEEMSRMEEDEDMDGEEDTTGDMFDLPLEKGEGEGLEEALPLHSAYPAHASS